MSKKIFFIVLFFIASPLCCMEDNEYFANDESINQFAQERENEKILKNGDEIALVQLCHQAIHNNNELLIDRIIDTAATKGMQTVMQCLDSYNVAFDNPLAATASKNPLLGVKPIHISACNGQICIAQFLINKGISIDTEAPAGYRCEKFAPIDFAIIRDQKPFIDFLTNNNANLNHVIVTSSPNNPYNGFAPIHMAAMTGNIHIMEKLLQNGVSLESTVTTGELSGATPLIIAYSYENLEMMKFLIDRGAAVDARLSSGMTALHLAVQEGKIDCVQFLLEHGASVHATITTGKFAGATSLHLAAHYDNLTLVDLLLHHGANIDHEIKNGSRTGRTPLCFAVSASKLNTAKTLIWRGARIDRVGPEWRKPVADYTTNQTIKEYLVKRAAGTQSLINYINLLRQHSHFESLQKKLIKRGNRPEKQMQRLKFLSEINHTQAWTCSRLIHYAFKLHHADPLIIDRDGISPLFYCIGPYDEQQPTLFDRVVYYFIRHGANLNISSPTGHTPVSFACTTGNLRLISNLLAHQANPTIGINPISTALLNGYSNLVEIFCRLAYTKDNNSAKD